MKKRINIVVIIFTVLFLLIIGGIYFFFYSEVDDEVSVKSEEVIDVNSYYSDYVVTNSNIDVYEKSDNSFVKVGSISSGNELSLDGIDGNYFKLKGFDKIYYIGYDNLDKISSLSEHSTNYKNYIPFNEKIITDSTTNFYDANNNLIYSFESSFEFSIIVKDGDRYGVIFNDLLLYISVDDIVKVVGENTSSTVNIKGISVLNYHFIYNDSNNCTSGSLCISEAQFEEHLSYIKENNYYTPTMNELEMYIDGKIQLPKSVVITADDGYLTANYKKLLEKYKLVGTMFFVTSWYDAKKYESKYMEAHSHGHDLHNVGICSGGQGGAIKCLEKNKLLADLTTSREKLNGSKYFCYPFYEYNDYSIETLKEAGFTMAFGGEYENGYKYVVPGIDKFKLPRWVIVNSTTMTDLISYLELR